MNWKPTPCASARTARVEFRTVGVILAVVPVHLIVVVYVFVPGSARPPQLAGLSPTLVVRAEMAAAETVSVKALFVASLTVPLQEPLTLAEVVTGVLAPPLASHVLSSAIEAMAALIVALLFGSAFAPEWSLWSHGFERPGLNLAVPEMVQVILLPGPAVIVVAPLADDDWLTKPTALSARTAPVAPSHFILFKCVSSVGTEFGLAVSRSHGLW